MHVKSRRAEKMVDAKPGSSLQFTAKIAKFTED
jgi:hypothetical protein